MIPVTRPFTPPIEEYQRLLEGIWNRNWFTNNGPLVNEFELNLKKELGLRNLLYVSNGTIAIQIAIKALSITKKVITTPFSYVATTSSLVWEGCTPVFVDIDPDTFNIDPGKIEECIDEDTEAILATHCFGNPCDIDTIEKIAEKYGLKVIYDAAHCFGTKYKGKSIFNYGDISTTSFHATKLFHTIEGGGIFTPHLDLVKRMSYMRNFGHDGFHKFNGVGINGKNSEMHAAMGLVNLKYIDRILKRRREKSIFYRDRIDDSQFSFQKIENETEYNFSYFPIVCKNESEALKVKNKLERNNIFPRRYFYPSLNSLDYVHNTGNLINAEQISRSILCLPLFYELSKKDQILICNIINE
ncbi:DegT/DnrJ/EryC1/StrS family aminotransferase [Lutimonas saemankumensis]|uniref:DegT/DnrJ/EryC1/StrS family aminotransferase n=1 Tax=Lutimonas saemankumensis TaxID=483016 RepID=UPI001CD4AFC9|nr:DegT/DnrJ/EryC1/StrS family aminotransferase [Lutimonas saemankumensis]MCA0931588.1 DegT/DnrJ/EryC1/StrS family aminotransferase [Lutimonas saemankumensis]